jgi:hypothetical protein
MMPQSGPSSTDRPGTRLEFSGSVVGPAQASLFGVT